MSKIIFDLQKFSTETPLNVIKKFMASLDTTTLQGTAALDEAVSVASGGYFSSIQDAINQMISDCQNSSSADNFLKNYCGINLDNTDTGAITGSDAGGSTVKTATSIVPESGSLNSFTGNSFTVNGLTVQLASMDSSYNLTDLNYSSLTGTQKYIWQALYTWWIPQALKLISESYGDNFSFTSNSSATTKKIYITFFDGGSGSLASTINWTTSAGMTTSKIAVMINNYYADTLLNGGNSDGEISAGYLLDRTLAHELTHAVMAANINYHNNLPTFIKEGIAELTDGIDDTQTYTIKSLANNSSSLASALSLSTNYNSYSYAGGYMFMRYLAKQAAENSYDEKLITGTSGADNITNTLTGATINALAGNDTISNSGENVLIDAGAGNDSIINSSNASTINSGDGKDYIYLYYESNTIVDGGSGNDTLWNNGSSNTILGGTGDDSIYGSADYAYINAGDGNDTINISGNNGTIIGGKGNDSILLSTVGSYENIIQYSTGDGNDTIYGFTTSDTLKISGNSYTTLINSNDIIVNVGESYILLKDGNTTARTWIGNMILNIEGTYSGGGTDTNTGGEDTTPADEDTLPAGWKFANTLASATLATADDLDLTDYGAAITKVDASKITGGVIIYGNSKNNSIKGGKGADEISGGSGNDTVSLGAGNDTYIYSSGNDLIQDYKAGEDVIKFETAIQSASLSNSNLVIKTAKGNVTVKSGKDKNISVVDSNDETLTIVNEYPVEEITTPARLRRGNYKS